MRKIAVLAAAGGLAVLLGQRETLPGDPLPGITVAEFERFRIGLEDFTEVEDAEEGLGPAFNGTSCAGCHNVPAIGGAGTITEVRAGRRDEDGEFHELPGGTLFHLFSIPDHRCQVKIPPEANVIARRISIPLFGAGLIEAIPDATLIALEDPEDANGDGVSGRAARIEDLATRQMRIGRFGWKAQHATLLAFAADAYRNEMGITNELFPDELAVGVDARTMAECDPAPDPEDVADPRTRLRGIDNFEAFLRLLAPIPRLAIDNEVRFGESVFQGIGCGACHITQLDTGPSTNPVFDRKPVVLWSDLLLHDVGTGDGIRQASGEPNEIRTPALWGLRLRRPFLHDGSAATVDEAIRRHGREAERSHERYVLLPDTARAAILKFLRSI
ncbi:MAG: di-heme oxidoredictase family protein [Bryobacteraceae bacterium]